MTESTFATIGGSARDADQTRRYANFDLIISRVDDGFRARVISAAAGETEAFFKAPFSTTDLEALADRLDRSRAATRRMTTPQLALAKEMGGRLHDAVLTREIRSSLTRAIDDAERDGLAGVRIRLHLAGAPDLSVLPWEFLFDPDPRESRFLALAEETPLVRYLELPERSRPLAVTPPIRLLAVVANPPDDRYPELDVEREWKLLEDALAQPIQEGLIKLLRLPRATLSSLQDELGTTEAHILHFIGHGRFDDAHQDGVLAFEGERGGVHEVSAEQLGAILYNEKSLRLVVLNACEGGRASVTDPYAGMAQTLVRMRVPAVVAMQYEITDRAAILFARQFYRGIAAGRPVDMAITDARLAIYTQASDLEWATPVLYMRAPDGRIFDVQQGVASPARESVTPPTPTPMQAPAAPQPAFATPSGGIGPGRSEVVEPPVVRAAAAPISSMPAPERTVDAGPRSVSAPSAGAAVRTLGVTAGFWIRTIAYLIDSFLVAIVISVAELSLDLVVPVGLYLFIPVPYFAFFWSTAGGGQTIGMRMLGLRVVRADGTGLDIARALIRYLGLTIAFIPLGLGAIWVAFDRQKRGWHDMMADTRVVHVGPGGGGQTTQRA